MSTEKYILTYDIGSTAVKLIVFDTNLKPVYQNQKAVDTYQEDGYQYQQAEDWWNLVIELTQKMLEAGKISAEQIIAIAATGQMEDCFLLDEEGKALTEVLLYSDGRAKEEYNFLVSKYGQSTLNEMTGNQFDSLMSINKYLWLKNKRPEVFKKQQYLLMGSKDYLNFCLTGNNVTDYTNASTTGFLDMNKMERNQTLMNELDFNESVFPEIKKATDIMGKLSCEAAKKLGLKAGTPVVNGAGDVGASTLGAGAWSKGDIYCYLGTTGWLAMPSQEMSANRNLFTLSNLEAKNYIIAGAVLNAGQTYDWFLKRVMDNDKLTDKNYQEVEAKLKDVSSGKVTFIPYLNGERSPLKVDAGHGIFANLNASVDRWQMLKAVLEGVSFSLKHNLIEMLGQADNIYDAERQINLIGGGSKSEIWPQLLADILESKVNVLELEVGAPSLGSAIIALRALDFINDYSELKEAFKVTSTFTPSQENIELYRKKYKNYAELVDKLFS